MSRLPLLLAAALTALPLAAGAETVRVRSGEHADFTRIVLEFDTRPSWSLSVEAGRARIVLPPGEWRFDTADVFTRIPRTRIAALAGGPDGLELTLGCDCRVAAFEVREAALAIDVAGSLPADVIRNLRPTSSDGSGSADAAVPPPPAVADGAPVAPSAPGAGPDDRAGLSAPDEAPSRARPPAAPAAPPAEADPPPAGGPPAADAAFESIAEGIARAVTQGVLSLSPEAQGDPPVPRPAGAPTEGPNLRLRLAGEEAWQPDEPPPGHRCLGDAAYDVAAWGPGDRPPAEVLAERRSVLAPDLDTTDESRAVDLARLYLSLGFGAEARAVLDSMAPRHPDAGLLSAMADVIEGVPPPPDVLGDEAPCPGRAQLWTALATGSVAEPEAVTVAVSELPLVLRRHLGPRLIDIFLSGGDGATAEAIRAAVDRAAGPHGTPFDLAAARLDAGTGADRGMDSIRDLATSPSPSSDEALILLLEVAHGAGTPVDAASMARAEMRAEDLRETPEDRRLEIGLMRALLRAGEPGRAATRLRRAIADASLAADDARALARATLSALAREGADDAVIVHAAAFRGEVSGWLRGDPAGRELAARLLDLGLPDLAGAYLAEDPADPGGLALAARLRLGSDDPAGALEILDRIAEPGHEALRTREQALRTLGRTAEADAVRVALGGSGAADGAEPPASGDTGRPAEASVEPAPAPGDGTSPRELVEASAAVRQRIDALLAETALP